MADVASTTDDQKRALLAAVAQQGSAGAQAYQQYADSVASQRAAAVAAAQQRSSLINAGPAATTDLAGTATATSDPYAKDAATGATAYANESGRLAQANSNYMEQLKAAIPLSANYAEGRIAAARSKKDGADNPLAQFIAGLGGEGLAKPQILAVIQQALKENGDQQVAQRTDQYNRDWQGKPNGYAIPLNALQNGVRADATGPDAGRKAINALETAQGIPTGALSAFLGKESPDYVAPPKAPTAAAKNKAALDDVRKSAPYQSQFSQMTEAYRTFTDKKGKYKLSATQAKQKIAQTARALPIYKDNEDAIEQAIKDLR